MMLKLNQEKSPEGNQFQSNNTLIEFMISEKIYFGKSTGIHLA